jgi:hypothetical protein
MRVSGKYLCHAIQRKNVMQCRYAVSSHGSGEVASHAHAHAHARGDERVARNPCDRVAICVRRVRWQATPRCMQPQRAPILISPQLTQSSENHSLCGQF